MPPYNYSRSRTEVMRTILLGGSAGFFVIALVLFPKEALNASLRGIDIWWEAVFPASLPFFIASELLMGFGIVHFLGVLLEPVMRPIFRVPGSGGFVLAMGMSSGFPIGAKLTARLRQQKLISRSEGERLISFTNNSNPLFLSGAVAVGFFHDVSLAIILMVVHYSSSILVGILMRFHERHEPPTPYEQQHRGSRIIRAFRAMHEARLKDGRPWGKLMGDSVSSSVNTLLLIGGFIIIYSVLVNVLSLVRFTDVIGALFATLLVPLGFHSDLMSPIVSGAFEITLGAKLASEASSNIPLLIKVAVTSGFIAFSGLSVHSQVVSLLGNTDIRYKPFLIAKCMQAVIATGLTFILWDPINEWVNRNNVLPSLASYSMRWTQSHTVIDGWWNHPSFIVLIGAATLWIMGYLYHKFTFEIKTWKKSRTR